jgi:hypothetical protein
MASGITNNPRLAPSVDDPLSVEYTLELSDHLALDMFLFDTVIRKSSRFRIKFFAAYLLMGSILTIVSAVVWWGTTEVLFTAPLAGYVGFLIVFAAGFGLLLPSGPLHQSVRSAQENRFKRARRLQLQFGLFRCPQHYRVVLAPEWFTETTDFRETGSAVEITERKETRVWWVAVASIDVVGEHAFFAVKDKGYLILPQAAFADKAIFGAFVEMARTHRETAQRAPATSAGASHHCGTNRRTRNPNETRVLRLAATRSGARSRSAPRRG